MNNGIPVIVFHIDESQGTIDAMNSSEDHSVKCYGSMDIIVPDGFKYVDKDANPETMMDVSLEYIRGRGNTTWGYDKKTYYVRVRTYMKTSTGTFYSKWSKIKKITMR